MTPPGRPWQVPAWWAGPDDLRAALTARRWVEGPTARGTRVLDPGDHGPLTADALPLDDDALVGGLRRRGVAAGTDPRGAPREPAEVEHAGRRAWVPAADLPGLLAAEPAGAVLS